MLPAVAGISGFALADWAAADLPVDAGALAPPVLLVTCAVAAAAAPAVAAPAVAAVAAVADGTALPTEGAAEGPAADGVTTAAPGTCATAEARLQVDAAVAPGSSAFCEDAAETRGPPFVVFTAHCSASANWLDKPTCKIAIDEAENTANVEIAVRRSLCTDSPPVDMGCYCIKKVTSCSILAQPMDDTAEVKFISQPRWREIRNTLELVAS